MAILDREILTDDIRELVERFMSTAEEQRREIRELRIEMESLRRQAEEIARDIIAYQNRAVRLTWKEKCKQLLAWSYSPFISQTLELAVGTLCSVSYLRYLGAF